MRVWTCTSKREREPISGKSDSLSGDDLAVFHADDAVGLGGEFFVVGDDDEGGAACAVHLSHEGKEGIAGVGVEVAGGLIGEDHIGTLNEGAGYRHALLFSAGEFPRFVLHPMF
mgnify:CR=1 FL=1